MTVLLPKGLSIRVLPATLPASTCCSSWVLLLWTVDLLYRLSIYRATIVCWLTLSHIYMNPVALTGYAPCSISPHPPYIHPRMSLNLSLFQAPVISQCSSQTQGRLNGALMSSPKPLNPPPLTCEHFCAEFSLPPLPHPYIYPVTLFCIPCQIQVIYICHRVSRYHTDNPSRIGIQ